MRQLTWRATRTKQGEGGVSFTLSNGIPCRRRAPKKGERGSRAKSLVLACACLRVSGSWYLPAHLNKRANGREAARCQCDSDLSKILGTIRECSSHQFARCQCYSAHQVADGAQCNLSIDRRGPPTRTRSARSRRGRVSLEAAAAAGRSWAAAGGSRCSTPQPSLS